MDISSTTMSVPIMEMLPIVPDIIEGICNVSIEKERMRTQRTTVRAQKEVAIHKQNCDTYIMYTQLTARHKERTMLIDSIKEIGRKDITEMDIAYVKEIANLLGY